MSSEIRVVLTEAALQPVTEPDWSAVLRRGRMAARRRLALIATGTALAIALAWTSPAWIATLTTPPSPDAAAPDRGTGQGGSPNCFSRRIPVTVFFREGVSMEQIDFVRSEAGKLWDAEGVYLVDQRGAYKDLVRSFEGIEDADGLPHHAFPAWLHVNAQDPVAARRIAKRLGGLPGVAEIDVVSRAEKRILCAFYQKGQL